MLTTGAPPVPVIEAKAGDAESLDVTEIFADLAPVTVGQNLALTVHDAPGARVCPLLQVPIPPKGKSPAFVPMMLSTPITRLAVPVFLTVVVCTALQVDPAVLAITPKVRVVGFRVSVGAPPVPVNGNWCGDPEALSFSVRFALRAPVAEGINRIE